MSSLTSLVAVPGYGRLSAAVLLMGLAMSLSMPFLSLFAANEARMSPLLLGTFMTLMSVSSIAVSALLGRWSDRRGRRRAVVLLAVFAAAAGYALLWTTHSYVLLVLIACVFLGTGSASFPQLFAYARAQLSPSGPGVSVHGVTALRTLISLAWVVGPAAGALTLGHSGFAALFLMCAACYALVGFTLAASRTPEVTPVARPAAAPHVPRPVRPARRPIALIALSFVLYGTSMSMSSISFPLFVTGVLGGTSGDVGFLVGLCALLEIPVMLSFVLLPRRFSNETMIVLAFALFLVYFVMIALSQSIGMVVLAQAARAVVMAITSTLGMTYFQDLMPDRVGAATTMFANTHNLGAILGGVVMGVLAELFGYREVFLACAVLSGLACVVLGFATRRGPSGAS